MDTGSIARSEPGSEQALDPVKEAEAAVDALADSFLEWISADIEKAKQKDKEQSAPEAEEKK